MENHSINYTYGSACSGNCTYFNYLANTNALALSYTNGHVPGSLGDYIALTSGNETVACNTAPAPAGNCGPFNEANIVDRIEGAHLSWKAYMEDYPSDCGSSCSTGRCFIDSGLSSPGHYDSAHNPFVYYQDILNNTSRCSKITRANSTINLSQACGTLLAQTDDWFLNDLSSTAKAPRYMFLTPNDIDDVHDCGGVNTDGNVSIGNLYLQQLVPKILGSTLFRTTRAALFITYDESSPYNIAPRNSHDLYTIWASFSSTHTKPTYKSIKPYDHFSFLRTIEENWGFSPFFSTKNDGAATDMGEFLI
jgi:hypothetical protein